MRAIHADRLSKTYLGEGAPVTVFRDLSLDVDPGVFAAIMGPSGVGKSTLLHLLGAIDRPDSGTVEIFRVLEDGREEQLTVIGPGNYFGELAPMFGLRRSAGARAIDGPATVTGLSLRDFRERRGRSEDRQVDR